MTHDFCEEQGLDTFTYLVCYRQIVAQLTSGSATSIAMPLNGADSVAVTAALEFAPCLRVPPDVVTMF